MKEIKNTKTILKLFTLKWHSQKLAMAALISFFSSTAFAQNLLVEAVHFDEKNIPWRVERKYVSEKDSTVYYIWHDNAGYAGYHHTSYLTTRDVQNGDTTVHEEVLGSLDIFPDSIVLQDIQLLGNYKTDIKWDSLLPSRTTRKYYVGGILNKIEFFDDSGTLYERNLLTTKKQKTSVRIEFYENSELNNVTFDTILWNSNATSATHQSGTGAKRSIKKLIISGANLKIFEGKSIVDYEFAATVNPRILFDPDYLHQCLEMNPLSLYTLDQFSLTSARSSRWSMKMIYSKDEVGRIISGSWYENNKLKYHCNIIYR